MDIWNNRRRVPDCLFSTGFKSINKKPKKSIIDDLKATKEQGITIELDNFIILRERSLPTE